MARSGMRLSLTQVKVMLPSKPCTCMRGFYRHNLKPASGLTAPSRPSTYCYLLPYLRPRGVEASMLFPWAFPACNTASHVPCALSSFSTACWSLIERASRPSLPHRNVYVKKSNCRGWSITLGATSQLLPRGKVCQTFLLKSCPSSPVPVSSSLLPKQTPISPSPYRFLAIICYPSSRPTPGFYLILILSRCIFIFIPIQLQPAHQLTSPSSSANASKDTDWTVHAITSNRIPNQPFLHPHLTLQDGLPRVRSEGGRRHHHPTFWSR